MYLQTWKELCHRDTETPARSKLSTYSCCLSAWARLLLPTIYVDCKIFGEEINIVLRSLNHIHSQPLWQNRLS